MQRLRRYFGDDFRSVDGVSPEDAINLEKQIVVIPIYGLTPELEEEIRREVYLGPHVQLRYTDSEVFEQ